VSYSLPPRTPESDPYDPHNPWRPTTGAPEQAARRRRTNLRILKIFGAVIVAFLALITLLGVLGSPSPAPVVVPSPVPTVAPAPVVPIPTLPPPDAPARPANAFTAGIHEVGNGSGQMSPGKYHTAGPGQGIGGYCYYARLRNTDAQMDSIIANVNTLGPATVTVKATDAAFEIQGDCTFAKVS